MPFRAVFTIIVVLAGLGLVGETAMAQQSCGLPLPCRNSVMSNDPALTITNSGNDRAGLFRNNNPDNSTPALEGRTNSTVDNAMGVVGRVSSTTSGDHSAGVFGINKGVDGGGLRIGVWGQADAAGATGLLGQSSAGTGVSGLSEDGVAVFGETTSASDGIGVWGKSNTRAIVGTQGDTSCAGTYAVGGCATTGAGAFGRADQGIGVFGNSNTRGVVGTQGSTSCAGTYGVGGCSDDGIGVFGIGPTRGIVATQGDTSCDGTYAVGGCATTGTGAFGRADSGAGVRGNSNIGIGVIGNSTTRGVVGTIGGTSCAGSYGVGGCAVDADGVVGRSSNGRAGFFVGNVEITGNLSKGSGAFKIDHPRDPENKYLYHSFVESSDMLSLYTGNVVLDQHGAATVVLPEWFEALNRDFRYQLTAIGAPAPNLHIAAPVSQNRFQIAGGQPQMQVSWQVTGVRHDPYAERHRIPVEEWKPAEERGKYLHPAAYGKSPDMGVHFVRQTDPADTSAEWLAQTEPQAANQFTGLREGGR